MKYKNKQEVQKLIKQLLDDQEIHDSLIDHDFELSKCLRPRQIKQINKVLQKEQAGYRLLNCRYSLPYNCNKTYKTPYLVNTESVDECTD